MEVICSGERPFVAASHENAADPGVWKKVLFQRADLQPGLVQMVNWARLPAGAELCGALPRGHGGDIRDRAGGGRIAAGDQSASLGPGDAVLVRAGEVHQMWSEGREDVEYVVVGVSGGKGGRTIVVGDSSVG